MLSSFSYGKIKAYFISRGYREGVEVCQVNPDFSSVIGRVKFMERYGLSVHQAAALALARRLLGCSERIPSRWICLSDNGGHVAFTVPVRKRVKHVWTYWGAISGQLRPALAAQRRRGESPSGPGCPGGLFLRGGLNADPFGVPGRDSRAEPSLHCWGGGASPFGQRLRKGRHWSCYQSQPFLQRLAT